MSTQIPETKWSEISIDFVTDLPPSANGRDSILVTVDKATRMVHLAPCRKNITATGTAQLLWNTVIRYHGIPRVIYSDRGAQFTASSWQELWRLTGTKLGFSSASIESRPLAESGRSVMKSMEISLHLVSGIWVDISFPLANV